MPEFLDAELSVLSNDVQYLYKMFRLVTIGNKVCLPRSADNPMGGYMALRYANPGALHHAHWVTLCNRVLRYYISQKGAHSGACQGCHVCRSHLHPRLVFDHQEAIFR